MKNKFFVITCSFLFSMIFKSTYSHIFKNLCKCLVMKKSKDFFKRLEVWVQIEPFLYAGNILLNHWIYLGQISRKYYSWSLNVLVDSAQKWSIKIGNVEWNGAWNTILECVCLVDKVGMRVSIVHFYLYIEHLWFC